MSWRISISYKPFSVYLRNLLTLWFTHRLLCDLNALIAPSNALRLSRCCAFNEYILELLSSISNNDTASCELIRL